METKSHKQLHIFFFPYMVQGHFVPLINIARLFASRGVKSTLIATPLNEPLFSKAIQSSKKLGFDVDILVIKFPAEEVGLPQGCENANLVTTTEMNEKFIKATFLLQPQIEQILDKHRPHCLVADTFFPWATGVAAKFDIPRIIFHGMGFFALCASRSVALYEPHAKLSSDSEVFTIPNFPVEIKLTRSQMPTVPKQSPEITKLLKEARESGEKSYGFIVNSFYELEPAFADHYRTVFGRKAWHIGPVSSANKAADDEATLDQHECLNWLNSKKPNSVVYICFGSMTNFIDSQLLEIAAGLEASGQEFIWVVKREKNDKEEWLPEGFEERMEGKGLIIRGWAPQVPILEHEGFEERMEGKGLIIRGWAPQVPILEHEAIGAFVTHCGWNSILEGVSVGVPMITWPASADQFYNEKLVTEVLKTGVAVGAKQWGAGTFLDVKKEASVKREAIEKAVNQVIASEEAEGMKGRARVLREMAMRAVEEGGSSFSDLTSLIQELGSLGA